MTQHTQPVGGGQHQHHQQQTSTPQQQQQQPQQTTTTPNTNNHNNTSNNNSTSTPINTNLSTNNNQTQNVAVQQQQQQPQHHQNNNNNSNNNYQSQQQQNATSGQMFNPQIPSGNAYAQPHLMPATAHHHPQQQHHHHQTGAMYPTMIPAAIPSSVYVHNVTANVNLHGWTHTVPHGAWVPPGGGPHYMHGDLPPEQGAPVMQSMGGMPVNLQTPNALAGPVMNPNPNAISGGTRGSRRGRGRGGTSGSRRGDYNMHRHPQPEGSPAPQQAGQNNPQDMQQQQQGQQTADGQQMILPPSYVPHSQYTGAQYPYVYPVFAPPPHMLHPGVQSAAMQRAAASGQPLYFSTMPLYNGHQMYNNVYYLPPVMNQSEYQYGEEVGVAGPLGDERQTAGEGGGMMWHQQPIYTDEYGMSPADMHAVSSDDMNHNASSMGSANETPNLLSPNYTPMYEQMTQQMGVMHIYDDPQMGQIQVMHPQIGGVPQLEEELSECGSQPSTAPIQMVPTTAAAPPPPMTIEHFIPLTDSAVMPIDDTLTPNVTTPQHQQQQPHQQQQQQSITEDNAIVDSNVQTYENVSNIQAGESVTSLNEEIVVQQPAADDNITIDYQQLPQQQQIQTETDVCEKEEEETTNFNKIMKMLTTYEMPEKSVEVTVGNVTVESVAATNVAVNQQQQLPQQTVYPQQQQTVQEKQHKQQQYVSKQNVPQQHQQLQTQPIMTAQQPTPQQQQTHYQASTQQQQPQHHHHHSQQQQHHHQQQQTYENRKSSQMYNQQHQSRSRKYDYHHGSTSSNSDASSSQHHHHHHHNQQQQTQQTTKTMSWTNSSQHKKSTNSVAVTATPTSSHSSGSYNKQSNATSNTSSSHTHATRTYTNQQHHNYQQQQQQQQNYHYQQQQQQPQTRNYGAMKMPSSPISSAPSTMERKTSQSSEAGKGNSAHTTSTASTTAAPHQFQQQQSQQTPTNDAAVQSPQQATTPTAATTVTAGPAANTTTNISNKQQQPSQHYPPGFATKKHSFSNQGHSVTPNTTATAAAATSSSSNTVETSSTPAINLAPPVSATTPAASSTPSWASLFASSANTSSSASTNTAASSTNLNTTSGSSSSNTSYSKKPIAKVAPYEGITPVTPPPPVVTPGTLSYSAASAQNLPTPAASTATTAKKLEQSQQSQRNSLANLDEFSLKFAQFLTNYKSDWATVSLRPRGLTNRSNYCYINSILQALLGCSPLYNLIRSIPKQVANLCEVKTPTVNAMMTFMSNFSNLPSGLRLRNAKGGKGNKDDLGGDLQCDPAFEPTEIYKLWNDSREEHVEGRQEDAEEFLSYILNKLNDEMLEVIKLIAKPNNEQNGQNEQAEEDGDVWQMICNNRNKGSVTRQTDFGCTPLSDIFRGELRSRLQREGEHSTDVIQPFFTLQLNIEKAASVKEALEILVGRDQLEGVTGSKSKQEVVAWQQMNLEKLPHILILHLKWFDYRSDGCTKILKKVEFPVELKIDSKILASKKYSQKQRAYRLFAVVYHDGKEATKGHYITDVYHTGYGSWLRYDDSSVKPVSENHVLLPRTPRVPYLLCYRRCDTIPQQSNNTQNNSSTGNNNSSGNTQSSSGK